MPNCNVDELKEQLEKLAFKKTILFCYSCYKDAPSGRCSVCMSDDLMRHLPGVGVEYGTEWVIDSLLEENLTQPDFDEHFEQMIDDIYGEEVQVGWLKLYTASIIKSIDPISWDIAKQEYIDSLLEDGEITTHNNGSTYYWTEDVAALLAENGIEIEYSA